MDARVAGRLVPECVAVLTIGVTLLPVTWVGDRQLVADTRPSLLSTGLGGTLSARRARSQGSGSGLKGRCRRADEAGRPRVRPQRRRALDSREGDALREVDLKQSRLLVVDDQEPNVRLVERILNRAGYAHVRTTTDSRQAVPLFKELAPDLVVLDL